MLNFKDIIDPISVEDFQKHYDAQQHFVIRGDKSRYEWIYNWNDFDKYMNGFPKNCGDLQIIAYNDNLRDKWCKKKMYDKEPLTKEQVYDLWKKGKTFILALQEYQTPGMIKVCNAIEEYYGRGTANLYCSPVRDSVSFPTHADSTDNFLVHVEGSVKWTLYNEFGNPKHKNKRNGGVSQIEDREYTVMAEYELSAGDLLYIPRFQYHNALALEDRISISFHFNLDRHGLKIGKPVGRPPWNNWLYWK